MEAVVKLRFGNLFDGPSDLIVLPSSTAGTVTGLVARSLFQYSIPHPTDQMALGDVEIMPFEGGENIAQYVAFAASVRSMKSSVEAIKKIGATLGRFTRDQSSVRSISTPLLGAGAGGLASEDVVAALRIGFSSTATPDSTMTIHVLHEELFERLRGNRSIIVGKQKKTVRVFISHTSTTQDQINWVKKLALILDKYGIQARLDKFHLRRGMDLPQWMCNELYLAEKVIVICDAAYKQKADGRVGGVGWETMIIQGDIARLPPDSTKYQVVVREQNIDDGLPMYLRNKYAFHAWPKNDFSLFEQELAQEILDAPIDILLADTEFSL